MEVHDEGNMQKCFGCEEAGDEDEADPEGVIETDHPDATKDSKDHPQQENYIHQDVGIAGTGADGQVHLGCTNRYNDRKIHQQI